MGTCVLKCALKIRQVQGELKTLSNGSRAFHWSHSYARVFPALGRDKYAHDGSYLQFQDFDVELRSRVMCVTASEGQFILYAHFCVHFPNVPSSFEGVPISTQWSKDGYYYSTQISQFSLSHWSKLLAEEEAGVASSATIYEDGKNFIGDWRGDTTRVTSIGCVHFDK